jgi:hypothetical protein
MGNDMEIIRDSGNVFRDLGHPNADREQLRALLAAKIIGVPDNRKAEGARRARSDRRRGRRLLQHPQGPSPPLHDRPPDDDPVQPRARRSMCRSTSINGTLSRRWTLTHDQGQTVRSSNWLRVDCGNGWRCHRAMARARKSLTVSKEKCPHVQQVSASRLVPSTDCQHDYLDGELFIGLSGLVLSQTSAPLEHVPGDTRPHEPFIFNQADVRMETCI